MWANRNRVTGPIAGSHCQRITVSGLTITQAFRMSGASRLRLSKTKRSKIFEGDPLRRFSAQHIELVAQQRSSQPEEPGDYPPNQFEHTPHEREHGPIRGFMPAG
jgi:hypothetical protein